MKLFSISLLLCSALHAADWALPAVNQGAWAAGTNVGVQGGIDQYLAGGASDRAVTGNVIDITASPYFAANNDNVTTGTITSGTATLTVASASGFTAGNYISFGMPAIHTLTITGGCTFTANLRIEVGIRGTTRTHLVAVVNGDTAAQVAAKIRASTVFGGLITVSGSGTDVIFSHPSTDLGAVDASYISDQFYSGVTGTFAVTQAGTEYHHRIDSVAGNVLTLTANAAASVTSGTVRHDTMPAVSSAIAAAVDGDVIYFPAGTYRFGTGNYTFPIGKPNITLRGAGRSTIWVISTTQQVFIGPDAGYVPANVKTVTGTKTKGTSTLTVSDGTGYTAGQIAWVDYENEVNNTRIQAGANPVWSSAGFPWSRRMTVRVTATTSTTVSIEPALPADATNLALRFYDFNEPLDRVTGWGFEDLSVTFDPLDHTSQVFNLNVAEQNWFYNIHFTGWDKWSGSGSCIKFTNSYRVEIRKCLFDAETGSSSDGAIETQYTSSSLIHDNICTGGFGQLNYDSGNAVNSVIAYNYGDPSAITLMHNAHPSLNLVEGNAVSTSTFIMHQEDPYHGSSSNQTLYRNLAQATIQASFGRFKRQAVLAGNIFGKDGTNAASLSWGNPNIGNGDANGFAGPTGLSDQVGELDYQQNGGTPNTYTIQAGDVFAGDFWQDWEITATLTTRTSDTVGEFTVSGGNWFVGGSPTGNAQLYPTAYWNSKADRTSNNGTVTAVSGSLVTISFPGATLPAQGTTGMQLYPGAAGWQERDLDVQASTTLVENYHSAASGTGSLQNGTSDTLPNSLAYPAKPAWFGSLTWPPHDPNSPVFDAARIPAGYRAINGNEGYLGGGGGAANATINQFNPGTLVIP